MISFICCFQRLIKPYQELTFTFNTTIVNIFSFWFTYCQILAGGNMWHHVSFLTRQITKTQKQNKQKPLMWSHNYLSNFGRNFKLFNSSDKLQLNYTKLFYSWLYSLFQVTQRETESLTNFFFFIGFRSSHFSYT